MIFWRLIALFRYFDDTTELLSYRLPAASPSRPRPPRSLLRFEYIEIAAAMLIFPAAPMPMNDARRRRSRAAGADDLMPRLPAIIAIAISAAEGPRAYA